MPTDEQTYACCLVDCAETVTIPEQRDARIGSELNARGWGYANVGRNLVVICPICSQKHKWYEPDVPFRFGAIGVASKAAA